MYLQVLASRFMLVGLVIGLQIDQNKNIRVEYRIRIIWGNENKYTKKPYVK